MTQPLPVRRSSPGGHAVSDALIAAGFVQDPAVALVETARPTLTPHAAVVSQNAWNFLPRREYVDLVADYAPRRRALYLARRAVAGLNTRRASTNVVLSEYMRTLLVARGRRATLAPVTLPWDLCSSEDVAAAGDGAFPPVGSSAIGSPPSGPPPVDRAFVLVPGTLTWYKDPLYALDLVARIPARDRPELVFAGTDDGSGCAQATRDRAAALGLAPWVGPVDRAQMKWLLSHAALTLVPSRLESLSLSMSEALLLSRRAAAMPIPVHREIALRLGREPAWLPPHAAEVDLDHLLATAEPVEPVDVSAFREQWFGLARALNLMAGHAS